MGARLILANKSDNSSISTQGNLFLPEFDLPVVPVDVWDKLARSEFRRQFHLTKVDRAYLQEKSLPIVLEHAADFIAKRLAPSHPVKDGRQTPWKGHPVFTAQHATGTCCRSCVEKWHHFGKGVPLTQQQQAYILAVIAGWLEREEQHPEQAEEEGQDIQRYFARRKQKTRK